MCLRWGEGALPYWLNTEVRWYFQIALPRLCQFTQAGNKPSYWCHQMFVVYIWLSVEKWLGCAFLALAQSALRGSAGAGGACWPRPFFLQPHWGQRAAVSHSAVKGKRGGGQPPSPAHLLLGGSTCRVTMRHGPTAHVPAQSYPSAGSTGEYINRKPSGDLDGKWLFWLHVLNNGKSCRAGCTQGSRRVPDWPYESCNMILFDWMHRVQIGFPLTPPPKPDSTSADER